MIPLLVVSHTKQALKRFLDEKNKSEKSIMISLIPQSSEYSIDQIREIKKEVKVDQPLKRIYLFEEFENSSLEAQNAFLKLLEEPPENVEFILTVSNPYTLLPTIISRTKIVRLDKGERYEGNKNIEKALMLYLSKKNLGVIDFNIFTSSSKEDCLTLLTQICLFFRERLSNDPKSAAIIKEILTVYRLVQNNNVNPQLAVDHLLIFIAKKYSMK